MRIDIHQHHWSEPLLLALSRRKEPPYVRLDRGTWVLTAAGEADTRLSDADLDIEHREALLRENDIDVAVVAPSSPIGIEDLPAGEAQILFAAYIKGASELPARFRFWGATSVWRPDPEAVDAQLDAGAVGIAIPAGALAAPEGFARMAEVLDRLERRGAPVFVHPGPGPYSELALGTPQHDWWPALTRYVAEMNASWHAFLAVGRSNHPSLKVVFAMLAGLAPLHADRLALRGGPAGRIKDPLVYYDTSSYGSQPIGAVAEAVGAEQLVFGSDLPVVDGPHLPLEFDDEALLERNPSRLLGLGVPL